VLQAIVKTVWQRKVSPYVPFFAESGDLFLFSFNTISMLIMKADD
jgi:hypothetical protein